MMNRERSDAGFTLVELLLAVAILGIVIVPLSGAIIVGLRTMDQTSHRYAASNDAQVLTRYLPPDVQSSSGTGKINSATDQCAGTNNRKLQLALTADGGTRAVLYWVRGPSAGRYELVRSIWNVGVACTSGAAPQSTVIARDIANASHVTVTPLTAPIGFKMSVTEAPAQNESTGYTFTVTGRKRAT